MPANHAYDPALDERTGDLDRAALDEALGYLERDRHRRPPPDLGGRLPGVPAPRPAPKEPRGELVDIEPLGPADDDRDADEYRRDS